MKFNKGDIVRMQSKFTTTLFHVTEVKNNYIIQKLEPSLWVTVVEHIGEWVTIMSNAGIGEVLVNKVEERVYASTLH